MSATITFVYAFRNRDSHRVQLSLESLKRQTQTHFEVVFVDYGSDSEFSDAVKAVVKPFDFANYHYVAHPGLLWNKSKALNYGIKHASSDYIFIADVDIIFHPDTVKLFGSIAHPERAYLFELGYIDKEESAKLKPETNFETIPLKHSGDVNGMILAPKKAFETVHGLDEFFHFYGSEDVDVVQRIEHASYALSPLKEAYFKHIWHPIYNSHNDAEMSFTPRLFDVKKINQKHYLYHKADKVVVPSHQEDWGIVVASEKLQDLSNASVELELGTLHSNIIHFFEVRLPFFQKEIVKIKIIDTQPEADIKFKVKKLLKRKTETYLSIKEVNDIILSKIVYLYRDYNYSYKIAADLKSLEFVIDLKRNIK